MLDSELNYIPAINLNDVRWLNLPQVGNLEAEQSAEITQKGYEPWAYKIQIP